MTRFFQWLETRLDEGGWVRRTYLVAASIMTWKVTIWSMVFAEVSKLPGVETAAVIGAVGVPIAAVQTFAFQNYLISRK